jgi:putative ABC transport system permease protein
VANGDHEFEVAGVFRDYASEHGRIFIDLEAYWKHWPDRRIDSLALFTDDSEALQTRLSGRFGDEYRLLITPAAEIYQESMKVFAKTFRITEVLRILSVLVAAIGILSALMALQLERRKEFAVLRALGLTGRQLLLLIVSESLLMGLIAAILSIPVGLIMAWVLTDAIQFRAFGWTMPFLVTPGPLLWTLLLGMLSAVFAGLYPAWQASRHPPAPYLREE